MNERAIEMKDVGPIHHLTIPVPAGGGITVLRGTSGCGKSNALKAAAILVGADGRPASRDGSLGAQVEGLGARLTVARSVTRLGELEVRAVDGTDPSDFVDAGGLKDPKAADAARVRALLRLSGSTVDVSAFAALVDGKERLLELCRPQSLDEKLDVTEMAAMIKRDLEAACRKHKAEGDNNMALAQGRRETLKALGGGAALAVLKHGSAEEARQAHTDAVREHAGLERSREQNAKLAKAAAEAQRALEELGQDGTDAEVENAKTEILAADAELERANDLVRKVEARLAEVRADAAEAKRAVEKAVNAKASQERAATQRATLLRAIAATEGATEVTAEQVTAAQAAIDAASAELANWAVRDKTEKVRQEIAALEQTAQAAMATAEALRAAAKATEGVVLDAVRGVCGDDMELDDGRLYVKHTERGERELLAELSDGERWKRAIRIAAKAVGRGGLLITRQQAFEGLPPSIRMELDAFLKEEGINLITAEAADGEIRAEVLGASAA